MNLKQWRRMDAGKKAAWAREQERQLLAQGYLPVRFMKPTRMLGRAEIGRPMIGHTQTFITLGNFSTEKKAQNAHKYLRTKFVQAMLSILKVTQDNTPEKWACVPLQDFSDDSDLDWSASLAELDRQLYRKYNLSAEEVLFIETHYEHGKEAQDTASASSDTAG